jgi:hypothetical protein
MSTPDLGPCCICETRSGVTNIVMLDRRAPVAGKGWGCVECGLSLDGAIAVLCDGCAEFVDVGATPIFVCAGYPSEGRALFADLPVEPFGHDPAKHANR